MHLMLALVVNRVSFFFFLKVHDLGKSNRYMRMRLQI
jgi:hypothetical protein